MLRWLAPVLLVVLASACDPCSGVTGCTNRDRFAYEGRVVVPFTRVPAPGVSVAFVRESGVRLYADTVRTITDREGLFRLVSGADEPGLIAGTLIVGDPESGSGYAEPVRLNTVSGAGEALFFGYDLASQVFVDVALPLRTDRGTVTLPGAMIEFQRTGGVQTDPDRYTRAADGAGNVALELRASRTGEVVGDLRITPVGGEPGVVRGVRYRTQTRLGRVWLDPIGTKPWAGYLALLTRPNGSPAAGAVVRVRRTGGVRTTAEEAVYTADERGYAPVELVPLDSGVINAELLVRTAPGAPERKIADLVMPTFYVYSARILGTYTIPEP
jgi:hypothetical protein